MTATSSLWHSREHALISLKEEYPEAINVLGELFSVVDDCGTSLFEIDSAFSRVTAITVAKSRNLAHGCYSLALDSLAQESGALVRPLIETIELLKYFRLKPSRAMEAIEGKLPKAGKIAQLIGSEHKGFRLQVVATNLHTLYSVLSLVGIEAVRCTQAAECENKFDLAERMEDLKYRGQAVFDEATGRIKKQEDCEAQYHAST